MSPRPHGVPPVRRRLVGSRAVMEATLPYRLYLDSGAFAAERERIFSRQWFLVGREEDVPGPGDWRRVDVAGEQLVLVRGEDDRLRAFANTCRHRGAELCPADGPEAGPRRPGAALPVPPLDLRTRRTPAGGPPPGRGAADVALHEAGVGRLGRLHLRLPAPRPDAATGRAARRDAVAATANYPLADLRRGARLTYEVAANWKVIVENYNECYHCGPVHPELCELVPAFRRGGGAGLDWDDGIPHRDGAWTFTTQRHQRPGRRSPASAPRSGSGTRARSSTRTCCSASRPTTSPRSRSCPGRAGHTTVVCDFLFAPPRRSTRPTSTRRTRSTSGTSSTARTGASARACSGAWPPTRPSGAGSRRWRTTRPTSVAGTAARMGDAIRCDDPPTAGDGEAERG